MQLHQGGCARCLAWLYRTQQPSGRQGAIECANTVSQPPLMLCPPAWPCPAATALQGSAEAVRSPQGWLSLEAYQEIGRKRVRGEACVPCAMQRLRHASIQCMPSCWCLLRPLPPPLCPTPHRQAPNFDVESRPLVHSVCAKYQQLKRIRGR